MLLKSGVVIFDSFNFLIAFIMRFQFIEQFDLEFYRWLCFFELGLLADDIFLIHLQLLLHMVKALWSEWVFQGVAAGSCWDVIIRCHRCGSLVRVLKYARLNWRVIFITEALSALALSQLRILIIFIDSVEEVILFVFFFFSETQIPVLIIFTQLVFKGGTDGSGASIKRLCSRHSWLHIWCLAA